MKDKHCSLSYKLIKFVILMLRLLFGSSSVSFLPLFGYTPKDRILKRWTACIFQNRHFSDNFTSKLCNKRQEK